jgi:hypothetical protein
MRLTVWAVLLVWIGDSGDKITRFPHLGKPTLAKSARMGHPANPTLFRKERERRVGQPRFLLLLLAAAFVVHDWKSRFLAPEKRRSE